MKKIKLNIKNLFGLGLTKEIYENDMVNWLTNNDEFYIDYKNEEILVGKRELKDDINNFLEILKNEHIKGGGTEEEFNKKTEEYKIEMREKMSSVLDTIPDNMKFEFLLKSLKDNDSKLKDFKDKIFKEKLEIILGNNYENEIISSPTDLEIQTENPYPRIFTSIKAYDKFKKLLDEFGNGSENLANYSFVYHRMKRDNLIFDDYQQTQFMYFLLDFDINIKRIKPKSQMGNNDLREIIYNSL